MTQHSTYLIQITNTGESYRCRSTESLLSGMEAFAREGIPVGCRGGGCGVCKVRIESGEVRKDKMSRGCVSGEEEEEGFVLACRAYPAGDVILTAVDPTEGDSSWH